MVKSNSGGGRGWRLPAADLNALSPSLTLTRALTGLIPKVILYKKTTQTAQQNKKTAYMSRFMLHLTLLIIYSD